MAGFSRRGFFGLLATGAVGACVATRVPTWVLPEPVRRRAACEFLRRAYNDHARGKGVDRMPREMYVGRELYEAYWGELLTHERFVAVTYEPDVPGSEWLAFKCARVIPRGHGWLVHSIA